MLESQIVPDAFRRAAHTLAAVILDIQARGDAAAARGLVQREGVLRPELSRLVEQLRDLPVDVDTRYVTAEKLLAEEG